MAASDSAALAAPITEEDPCGPDLDLDGDINYMSFVATAEGMLPTSYFSAEDGRPFDRSTIDFKAQHEALRPLLKQTRDLRLLTLRARFQVLDRDLSGFASSLAAMAELLDRYWDEVHPRAEGGSFALRMAALGTLNVPTVIFPLQYMPLCDNRRLGPVTYRAFMIANNETKAREGEAVLSPSAVQMAIRDAEPDVIRATREHLANVQASLALIRKCCTERGNSRDPVRLDSLTALVDKLIAFCNPDAVQADAAGEANAAGAAGIAAFSSVTEASAALAAVANYYSRNEPSNPALPLVRQAEQLIGKSFAEVVRILVPAHADQAIFHIGGAETFELPLDRLSEFSSVSPAWADTGGNNEGGASVSSEGDEMPAGGDSVAAPGRFLHSANSRSQALMLLDQVQRFFRLVEPSSPVPLLCDRARALAERDFLSVLRDVLPAGAFKDSGGYD